MTLNSYWYDMLKLPTCVLFQRGGQLVVRLDLGGDLDGLDGGRGPGLEGLVAVV